MSRHRLLLAAALSAALILLAADLYYLVQMTPSRVLQPDFYVYYLAAQTGLKDGWAQMYNPAVFIPPITAAAGRYLPYLNPPPLAWLIVPLTLLPYRAAAVIWTVLLSAFMLLTWWLAAPGKGLARVIHLAAAGALLTVFMGIELGQVTFLVMAGVALSWWLARKGRPLLGGLVLSTIALKPQLAFLVPVALLVAGHRRLFLGWALATVPLAALSLLAMGPQGPTYFFESVGLRSNLPNALQVSAAGVLGSPQLGLVASILFAALCLLAAFRWRGRGLELPFALGILGTLLVSPYLNFYDLSALVLAAWLVLRANPPTWQKAVILFGYLPLFVGVIWPAPVVAYEGLWLISLLMLSFRLPAATRADSTEAPVAEAA